MFQAQTRREWLKTVVISAAGAAVVGRQAGAGETPPAGDPPYRLYAMDTGLRGPDTPTPETKAALLKKLGYAGMEYTFGDRKLPETLAALDKEGLEFVGMYLFPTLEGEIDKHLAEELPLLKGRKARIELAINSREFKPSDPAGDAKAADIINRVADLCGDAGPVVSIYPHRGSWTERVEDGVRLAKRIKRPTVGTNFNLVHWQWVTPAKPADELLAEALPHLFAVTINGLDKGRIVSLDEGDFDVAGFMASVKKAGYKGPVGLQGYGIAGPSETHLARSMTKWREIMKALGK